jgi:hypothetical protein
MSEDDLALFADGKGLTVGETQAIQAHLAGCSACTKTLEKLTDIIRAMREKPEP